ncbi:hypothetical protein BHM03_00017316 [Ensete ventricosum]|nr:hypothetical protein BHM03_00017316 [Ensete ventricosum]
MRVDRVRFAFSLQRRGKEMDSEYIFRWNYTNSMRRKDVVAEGAVPVLLEYPSVRPVPYPIEEEREERCLWRKTKQGLYYTIIQVLEQMRTLFIVAGHVSIRGRGLHVNWVDKVKRDKDMDKVHSPRHGFRSHKS